MNESVEHEKTLIGIGLIGAVLLK